MTPTQSTAFSWCLPLASSRRSGNLPAVSPAVPLDMSLSLEQVSWRTLRLVSTVCDEANEVCSFFPGASKRLHWSLPDLAAAEGTEEDRLEFFRSLRERLR